MGIKRSVEDKDWGPVVKTVMTRCIQCTRCVRFASEVAGVPVVGVTGRGSGAEIGRYHEKPFLSEISGNVVDLCPVGALTAGAAGSGPAEKSQPFSFRPWELRSVDAIDVTDSNLTPVRYQYRGGSLMRILPRENETAEWVTDKGRYSALDGSTVQRISTSSTKLGGKWVTRKRASKGAGNVSGVSSSSSGSNQNYETVRELLHSIIPTGTYVRALTGGNNSSNVGTSGPAIRVICSANIDCKSFEAISKWSDARNKAVGSRLETLASYIPDANPSNSNSNEAAGTNTRIIGYNPRIQNAVRNVQLRERYLEGQSITVVGGSRNLTYEAKHAGLTAKSINAALALEPKSKVVVGSDVARRYGAANEINVANSFENGYTRSNEAFRHSSNVTPFQISNKTKFEVQIIIGATEAEFDAAGFGIDQVLRNSRYNIVISSQGAEWRKNADAVVPVKNEMECDHLFRSSEGKYVMANAAASMGAGNALEGSVLSIEELFNTGVIPAAAAATAGADAVAATTNAINTFKAVDATTAIAGANFERSTSRPITVPMVDFHLEGHPFAEASSIMAKCSAVFREHESNFN